MQAKKLGGMLFMASLCLCLFIGKAFAAATVQTDYEAIVNEYAEAVHAETVQEALSHLELLRAYYEQPGRAQALETYEKGNALVYYTYAKGMIAFEQEDYYTAWQEFERLQGTQVVSSLANIPELPDTTYYYQFSLAMLHWKYGDYESAFAALESARTAAGASATACMEAKEQLSKAIKQEASFCCSQGNHQRAQAYYQLYIQYVNQFEGRMLLNECEQHSQTAPLKIVAATGTGPSAISVSWTGEGHEYLVSWSNDLTGRKTPETRAVKEKSLEITGLLPGTEYRVTVSAAASDDPGPVSHEAGKTDETVARTLSAAKLPSDVLHLISSETAGITRSEAVLKKMTPGEILDQRYDPGKRFEKYYCLKEDHAFSVSEATQYALYCFVSYRNLTGQEINMPSFCVLRSSTFGVYRTETQNCLIPADDQVYSFWIRIDDLIQAIQDDFSALPQDQYIWEIYFDGKFFCRGFFSIQ